jgi:NAD-dependent DNA ligase
LDELRAAAWEAVKAIDGIGAVVTTSLDRVSALHRARNRLTEALRRAEAEAETETETD